MKTAFIGHRRLFANDIFERINAAIREEINNGCMNFTMGRHGAFDTLALYCCRQLRNKEYNDMDIEVEITGLSDIKGYGEYSSMPYDDIKTVMYEIEDEHYKRQITTSNKRMIDTCDTLICYVDNSINNSDAKTALQYAEKRGLKIVNLYREHDKKDYYDNMQKMTKRILGRIV